MNAYVYQAELLCEDCAFAIRAFILEEQPNLDPHSTDSDHWPQGPYADGGGESDSPQHCGSCFTPLDNPVIQEAAYKYTPPDTLARAGYEVVRQSYARQLTWQNYVELRAMRNLVRLGAIGGPNDGAE